MCSPNIVKISRHFFDSFNNIELTSDTTVLKVSEIDLHLVRSDLDLRLAQSRTDLGMEEGVKEADTDSLGITLMVSKKTGFSMTFPLSLSPLASSSVALWIRRAMLSSPWTVTRVT